MATTQGTNVDKAVSVLEGRPDLKSHSSRRGWGERERERKLTCLPEALWTSGIQFQVSQCRRLVASAAFIAHWQEEELQACARRAEPHLSKQIELKDSLSAHQRHQRQMKEPRWVWTLTTLAALDLSPPKSPSLQPQRPAGNFRAGRQSNVGQNLLPFPIILGSF